MRLTDLKTRIAVGASIRHAAKAFVGLRVTSLRGARSVGARSVGARSVGATRLQFTDDDPSIIFEFDRPGATGEPCLIIFEVAPSRSAARAKLYLDEGHGFSEDRVIAWSYGKAGVSAVAVQEPSRYLRLRWDPDDRVGEHVDLFKVSTRPLSPTETSKLAFYGSALGESTDAAGFNALYETSSRLQSGAAGASAETTAEAFLLVIPSFGEADQLERLIPTLDVARERILVVDLGRDDRTAGVCDAFGLAMLRPGEPKSRAQCCNIALRIAEGMKARYLMVTSEDVRFVTKVARELATALADDEGLGIVSPSQVVIDERAGTRRLAQRATWNLDRVSFAPDFTTMAFDPDRLDADFCDFTCALMRVAAVQAVGGFDEDFGSDHEDADLCFRLRMAGYGIAALPRSQIEHEAASPGGSADEISADPASERSRRVFARKHLGYGVSYRTLPAEPFTWQATVDVNLVARLTKDGLIDDSRPQLVCSRPGLHAPNYVLTDRDAGGFSPEWLKPSRFHRAVLVADGRLAGSFDEAGIAAHRVPPGVDTDIYTPWGPAERLHAGTTYLCWVGDENRHALDVMIGAWQRFHEAHRDTRLILMGRSILRQVPDGGTGARQLRATRICELPDRGLLVRQPLASMSQADFSQILRGIDFLTCPSVDDGFGFPILEAMACGTPTLVASRDAHPHHSLAMCFKPICEGGPSTQPDASWESDAAVLFALLEQSHSLDGDSLRLIRENGLRLVRNNYTWRHTNFAIRHALTQLQEQGSVGFDGPAQQDRTAAASMVETARGYERRAGESAAARVAASAQSIEASLFEEFDADFYIAAYPDVPAASEDPLTHYLNFGWREGRNPSPHFSTAQWLAANARVRRALLWREVPPDDGPIRRSDHWPADPGPTAPPIILERHRAVQAGQLREGVLFIGYVEALLGLGQALRGTLTALAPSSLTHAVYPFNRNVETRFVGPFMAHLYDQYHPYRVNVFEMAPDQLQAAVSELGPWRTTESHNILKAYWELPEVPDEWRPVLAGMDEIWAPSRFVAEAFARMFTGPITLVPPFVETARQACFDRPQLGLKDELFTFLFTFDYNSFTARKNPLGVLEAFSQAFASDEAVRLVIKSVGSSRSDPRIEAAIGKACKADPRITVLDGVMTRDQQISLIDAADCYVSLHRSEGFGLGMAEAMSLGKPVIGTGYSGNVDFLSDRTGFPVAFSLRALRHGEYVFSGGQHWADPSLDSAVEQMRRVFTDPEERMRRARAGQAHVAEHYGAQAVRRAIETRLSAILAGANGGPSSAP